MAHSVNSTYHRERKDAEDAQKAAVGQPGYSEVYRLGVFPCRLQDRVTGETYDGFESRTERYSG